MIQSLTTVFFLLLGLYRALYTLRVCQIKEYRFDRFRSKIQEEGIFPLCNPLIMGLPSFSPRNMLIIGIVIALLIPYGMVLTAIPPTWHIIAGLCNMLYAICTTLLAVAITAPYATYKRQRIIARAMSKMRQKRPKVVAISGSYGKSSTKEILAHILSNRYTIAKTDKNMNTDVGIALSILRNVTPQTDIFIAEMGAYQRGENKSSCHVSPPDYAIMTGLGNQHIDLFGSWENVYSAETEPLKALSETGIAYVNADIPEYKDIVRDHNVLIKGYSIHHPEHIYATKIDLSAQGSRATIHYGDITIDINTRLLGSHVIQNILPCIAYAIDMGIDISTIVSSVQELPPIPHKLQVKKGLHDALILDDSYNSCYEGFVAAIQTMQLFEQPHKLILSKGIIELGNRKKATYHALLTHLRSTHITLHTTDHTFQEVNNHHALGAHVVLHQNESDLRNALMTNVSSQHLITIEGRFTPSFIASLLP